MSIFEKDGGAMEIRETIPENAPEAVSENLKTKISWGSMPPDPLVYMYLCTCA